MAGALAAVVLATGVTPVFAGGVQKYNEKTTYNYDVVNKKDNTLKKDYRECSKDTKGAIVYKTYEYDTVNKDGFKECDKATYDVTADELRDMVADGFTDWQKVDVNSKELKEAKGKGNDYWKSVTVTNDDEKALEVSKYLTVFDQNGKSFNYIAKEDLVLCNHTRGNVMYGGTLTNKGTIDGDIQVLNTENFDKYWNEVGQKFGTKVTQRDADKLAWNYANEWMRKLTDDGSDQKVRYGIPTVYYYEGTDTLNWNGIWGVLIAPNAEVKVASCNWCGTIVAKAITSCGEAHLWNYSQKTVDVEEFYIRNDVFKYYVTTYNHSKEEFYCVKYGSFIPQTGDNTVMALACVTVIAALGVVLFVGNFGKKKED